MKNTRWNDPERQVVLDAETAADLMTSHPLSIREDATLREAVAFLTDKGFSAAPVIDEAGRPVGVLSRADLVVHERETIGSMSIPSHFQSADLAPRSSEASWRGAPPAGPHPSPLEGEGPPHPSPAGGEGWGVRVRDIMTPGVFSVTPDTAADKVIEEMVSLNVHRLFVIDQEGVLVGVISALDVLRRLRVPELQTVGALPHPWHNKC